MKLKIHIHKLKSIDDLSIELPVNKGLYAITGQNGSGKSTIAGCAAAAFYNLYMNEYFGKSEQDSYVEFEYNNAHKKWFKNKHGRWIKQNDHGFIGVNGFFEGSLIFGNRFKDTSFEKVKKLEKLSTDSLDVADEFLRKNLGTILQGNPDFYEKLFSLTDYDAFKGTIFFYEKNGKRVSQFHMSTGENLLLSILNSLNIRIKDRTSLETPCLMLLDEIELALHPSSLRRLVDFLKCISQENNFAIYFSTHSLELIGSVQPSNIFYIQRYEDDTMSVVNPCYPAYATRMLFMQNGYDNIFLVEDDLAKAFVDHLIFRNELRTSKLIYTMPVGGWTNVLEMANESIRFSVFGNKTSVSAILDADIKNQLPGYVKKHSIVQNMKIGFLPIPCLEKYLKAKLLDSVDHQLYLKLDTYVFQCRGLAALIEDYKIQYDGQKDSDGKKFYSVLETELNERKIERSFLINLVIGHLFDESTLEVAETVDFLKGQLGYI